MNSLKFLKNLLQHLTNDERKAVLKFLNFKKDSDLKEESKSILLFNLLNEEKNYSLNEIQYIIYKRINYFALSKLSSRLKQKILDAIILNSSLLSNSYSKRNIILLDLRKKLLLADILQLKGLRSNIFSIYNNIVKISKKFELYEVQVQALGSIKRLQSGETKLIQVQRLNKELQFAEQCSEALKKSNTIFGEILNKINSEPDNLLYKIELEESITRLKKNYEFTNSPTIGFFLYTLIAGEKQNKYLFNDAQSNLEIVKNLLLKNESAYTDNRYGNVLLNLANNNIYLFLFNDAIKLALESKKYFINIPYTLKIVDEILFYAYFYKLDINKCNSVLKNNLGNFENEVMKSKYFYFQSCLHFIDKNYNESLLALENCKDIESDREGWNINRRILIILNRIELEDHESVDLQVQNLEKFIKRATRDKYIKPRYVLILRILSKLINENYNFKSILVKRNKYISLLSSKNNEYSWVIKSPELILFHNWFKSRIENNSLYLSFNT